MSGVTRTLDGSVALEESANKGYAFAKCVMPTGGVSKRSKKRLDDILKTDVPRRKQALQVAGCSVALEAAEHYLISGYYAGSTINSYGSNVKLYEEIIEESGWEPWPLTAPKIKRFGSVLKGCNYKSARMYFSAIAAVNCLMGYFLTDEEKHVVTLTKRACLRDSEADKWKEPMTRSHLEAMGRVKLDTCGLLVARLCVVAFAFLLRPEELLKVRGWCTCATVACKCGADIRMQGDTLTLLVRGDKVNQSGLAKPRTVECRCCHGEKACKVPVCAVCCVRALKRDSLHSVKPKLWHLSQGRKKKRLGYDGFLKQLRKNMVAIGETLKDEHGVYRFGGQSMRRAGAQQMALRGTPIHIIQIWGRWGSWVVDRYVREVPLKTIDVSSVLFGGECEKGTLKRLIKKVSNGEKVLVPDKKRDMWVQGKVAQCEGDYVQVKLQNKYVTKRGCVLKVKVKKVIRL